MRVALGYQWFCSAAGYHLERGFAEAGHPVTYVGLPAGGRPGYDSRVSVPDVLAGLAERADLYLWVDPAGPYFPAGIERCGIPTACYLIDVHLGSWRVEAARFFDHVFVAQRDYVAAFCRALGHNRVHWLPLAAASDVHRRHDVEEVYDVGFVGNQSLAHRGTARARRLTLLSGRFRTNDFGRSYTPAEVGMVYSQSRMVFNTSLSGDVNMRVFEGTACGAMLVTDAVRNGLDELYRIGKELVTYRDDRDLVQEIEYYLAHDEERSAIAAAGMARALSEHTYAHRAAALARAIGDTPAAAGAPLRAASPEAVRRSRWAVWTHLHMADAILDDARAAGMGPARRAWAVAPVMARRLLR